MEDEISWEPHHGTPWPDAKTRYPHYFCTYIPGVGTKFEPVGDTGEGDMKTSNHELMKIVGNQELRCHWTGE
jgi:hypothetical protein